MFKAVLKTYWSGRAFRRHDHGRVQHGPDQNLNANTRSYWSMIRKLPQATLAQVLAAFKLMKHVQSPEQSENRCISIGF